MLLYNSDSLLNLIDYGILIPCLDDRPVKTYEALLAHPLLAAQKQSWHYDEKWETVTQEDLLRVHTPEYIDRLFSDAPEKALMEAYELVNKDGSYHRYNPAQAKRPLKEMMSSRLLHCQGTLTAGKLALENGFSYFLGGGGHHAHANRGTGFCLLNDIVIALRALQAQKKIKTAWVIDVDAHKGDGTAALTAHDPSILTLSIHMAQGWPLDEGPYDELGLVKESYIPSTLDIPIPVGGEKVYYIYLQKGLEHLELLAKGERPDLVLVVHGSDPYEKDELKSTELLKLTKEQMFARDRLVYDWFNERNIPQGYIMAGGYGQHSWEIHATFIQSVLLERLDERPLTPPEVNLSWPAGEHMIR